MLKSLALSAILVTSPVYASSNDLMLSMIDFIVEHSKYTYNGEPLPYIQIKEQKQICIDIVPEYDVETPCDIAGYYDDSTRTIVVSDNPGRYMVEEGFIETVVLHELVHYLQDLNNSIEKVDCRNALERDAYKLQSKYVEFKGYPEENKPDPLFAFMVSTCRPDYGLPE